MQGQDVGLWTPQLPAIHSSLVGRGGGNRLLFRFSDQSHLAPAQPPFGMWGFDFGVSVKLFYSMRGMTAGSGCRDGWRESVPGSRSMAKSMSSRESSCCPELSLPGEVNQMCPALAGKFSLPQELMLRRSFPLSFGERFSTEHLSLPQQTGTSLVLSPKSQSLVLAGGCCRAVWGMLHSTAHTPPLHNPPGCSSS